MTTEQAGELVDGTLAREFHTSDRSFVALRLPSREDIARVVHQEQCGCPLDDEAHREHQLDPIQYPHYSHLADAILALLRRAAQTPTELDSRLTAALDRHREQQAATMADRSPESWRELADLRHEIALIFGTAASVLSASTVPGQAALHASSAWQEREHEARRRAEPPPPAASR